MQADSEDRQAGPTELVASYLSPPHLGEPTVYRERLLDLLTVEPAAPIALISGEAASGKTSLLVQRVQAEARTDRPQAWLTVPPRTDDDAVFWRYFVTALATVGVRVDDLLAALFDGEPPEEGWLVSLVNRLDRLGAVVIAIDDLHELESHTAQRALCRIIELASPGVTFVVATRVVPDWPLAAWRMSRRLVEIGADDLRLTVAETRDVLAANGLALDDGEVGVLVHRTEGWAGGVQLAVLAMQRTADPSSFLAEFAADDDEMVSTYLLREVLDRQPDELREFLLDIAVLEVATVDTCDAVRGAGDSAELLEQCRDANVFLTAISGHDGTYRLHPLFRELLRATLQLRDRERFDELNRRAVAWYESSGDIGRAIESAIQAGDGDRAGALAFEHAAGLGHRAQFDELRRWASMLRDAGLVMSSRDLLAMSAVLCFCGEADETIRMIDVLDRRPLTDTQRLTTLQLRAAATMVRGDVHTLGALGRSIEREARAARPDGVGAEIGGAMFMAGVGALLEGDLQGAGDLFEAADDPGIRPLPPAYIAVRSWAALAAYERGDLSEADRCARIAIDRRDELESGDTAAVATAFLTMADLAWEQDRLDECSELLARARRSVSPMPWQAVLVECARSRLAASRGALTESLNGLTETGKLYLSNSASPLLTARVARCSLDLTLALGDLDAAQGWAHTFEQCRVGELAWAQRLGLARLTSGEVPEDLMSEALTAEQRHPARIDTLLFAAAAASRTGDLESARSLAAGALGLAEPHGMVRRFVDAGPPIGRLVRDLADDPLAAADQAFSRFFAATVADACAAASRPSRGANLPSAGLVEPLSDREVEVLALLADGLSYTDMAAALFVSRNTIKSHVRHVYTKLAVSSRVEAADTARQLGLI